MSLHQNNKLLFVHDKRCFDSHWPPASEIGMRLITTFLELHVVAGRSRTRAGRPHAVSGRPMLIHTDHAVPLPRPCRGLERSLSERHIRGMAGERHGESNTAALCKSNGKDTIYTLSGAAWHVRIGPNVAFIILTPSSS
jgi:hypothetical protein